MRALYGQKNVIADYVESSRPIQELRGVPPRTPHFMLDVTIPIRFALDKGKLHLQKMASKQNLVGFFNPIPPFKREADRPVLCVIYTLNNDPSKVWICYYSDKAEVIIKND